MRRFAFATVVIVAAACTKDSPKTDTASVAGSPSRATPPAVSAAAPGGDSAANAGNMANMAMTGDPDHDFLRMMSDHHKGMIGMAHETVENKEPLGVKAVAKRLDAEQDKEIDRMSTMLDSAFKDSYTPKVTSDNQAMIDALKGKSGTAYDRTFLENVIKHHQQAVKMIDDYLPKGRMPALKAMAEKMKATQQKEIKEFESRVQAMKS